MRTGSMGLVLSWLTSSRKGGHAKSAWRVELRKHELPVFINPRGRNRTGGASFSNRIHAGPAGAKRGADLPHLQHSICTRTVNSGFKGIGD
jgi:hypothetical protein